MSTKFYSIRVEVPVHHEGWPQVLALLGWLKGQGVDSEVNEVTVSTPPQPKSYYFTESEWGRVSIPRGQVLRALRELGPSKTADLAAHLGWEFQRTAKHLSALGKGGLVIRATHWLWALAPPATSPSSDPSGDVEAIA